MMTRCRFVLRTDPTASAAAESVAAVRYCEAHGSYDVGPDGCAIGARERIADIEIALRDVANWPSAPPGGWTESDVEQIRQRARDALVGN